MRGLGLPGAVQPRPTGGDVAGGQRDPQRFDCEEDPLVQPVGAVRVPESRAQQQKGGSPRQ